MNRIFNYLLQYPCDFCGLYLSWLVQATNLPDHLVSIPCRIKVVATNVNQQNRLCKWLIVTVKGDEVIRDYRVLKETGVFLTKQNN